MKLHMKRFLMVLILCMCLQFNSAGNALNAAPPSVNPATVDLEGPVVQIDERTYAFGIVKGQREIEHSFSIKNIGTEPLEISNVQTS